MSLGESLSQKWYERRLSPALFVLAPLWAIFVGLSALRRVCFRLGLLRCQRLAVPVVVVGNITVGGAGKTPVVLHLVRALRAAGRRPGIISRGYGRSSDGVLAVEPGTAAADCGDEPLLLAQRVACPVFVGRDRVAAGQALLAAHPEVDVIVSDDGLQHYRLARDAEVALFDGRGIGNGWRLPLGPLRESLARLRGVSAVVFNGERRVPVPAGVPAFDMVLAGTAFYRLGQPEVLYPVAELKARWAGRTLHAVAGIGHPERFFATLAGLGLACTAHPFPDHHAYTQGDLDFGADAVVLMTEKDAVKCRHLNLGETWVLPVTAELPPALVEIILEKMSGRPAS